MLGKSKSFIAPKEKGFTHAGYLYWIIVSYLLAWQTRSLAGEVCIRKHVGYRSFNVAIELFIKELRRKQKLRDNSKVLANALLIITVKPSLNDHKKWLLLWWGWSLWESNCRSLVRQKRKRKCIETGKSICFSQFFSHSEQCALYYIQRTQM